MSEEFEDYFTEVENSLSQCTGGRDLYALKLVHKNYFRIKTGFYEDESPEEISNEICMSINEMVKDGKVTCNNCYTGLHSMPRPQTSDSGGSR